jgi:hypothetical protein
VTEHLRSCEQTFGVEGARRDVLVGQAARQVLRRGRRGAGGLQQGALEGGRGDGRGVGRTLAERRSPDAFGQALAELPDAFAGDAAELAAGGLERGAAAAVPAPAADGDLGRTAGFGVLCDRGQFGLK